MLTKFGWLSFTGLLIGFAIWSDCGSAQRLKTECEGLAVIAPRGVNHGTIYLKGNPDGTLYRAGYLPVGSVVVLKKPPSEKAEYCAFGYEDEINGYLDRRDVSSLTKVMAELNLDEVFGFVAPDTRDNSINGSNLQLFADEALSRPSDSFGVTNRPIIFLMTKIPTASKALLVKYAPNARTTQQRLQTAYIRADDDRATNFDAGTFRIQKVRTSEETSPSSECEAGEETTVPADQNSSWLERWYARLISAAKASNDEIKKHKEKILKLADCGWSGSISGGLKVDLGLSFGADIKWEKSAEKIFQFIEVGNRCDLKMRVVATAHCRNDYPVYLEQADFKVIGGTTHTRGIVDRITATQFIEELKSDEGSPTVALGRELAQLSILPYSSRRPYWKDFEAFRTYVHDDLFERLKFPRNDKMTATLLLAETLIYFRSNTDAE